MQIKLTFLGAAQSVTGSSYLLEANGSRVLVDCGICEERECHFKDWEPFPVPPDSIDAILLTHAHLDHTGLLPKLVREGFRGPVYCNEATADITKIILLDAGKLQEEDAEFKKKRHEREGRQGPYPEVPLYTQEEAKASFPLFTPIEYNRTISLTKGIEAVFYEAGHVLGSSNIKIKVRTGQFERSILFSGDIGTANRPIIRDPAIGIESDYVLVESTYGDRSTEPGTKITCAFASLGSVTTPPASVIRVAPRPLRCSAIEIGGSKRARSTSTGMIAK